MEKIGASITPMTCFTLSVSYVQKKSQSTRKRSVWYLSPTSGSFLTKKAELSFSEGDSQRRNLLKLSIKKYEKMLDSLYVKKYEKMWDRVVLLLGICNLVQAGMYKIRKIS